MENPVPKSLATQVWLLRGIIHSLPGILRWKDGQLELILYNSGTLGWKGLVRLEEELGVADLSTKLPLGNEVRLFACTPASLQRFSLPWYYFGGGIHLWVDENKYRLSLLRPNNTQLASRSLGRQVETVRSIARARQVGRQWKAILGPAIRQIS